MFASFFRVEKWNDWRRLTERAANLDYISQMILSEQKKSHTPIGMGFPEL